ncbi:MAG: hypothetical protein RLZZ148_638 [Cyanobacteriota bacterium]
MEKWHIFKGNNDITTLPEPPKWRNFGNVEDLNLELKQLDETWTKLQELSKTKLRDQERGKSFYIPDDATEIINAINAALYLRRPLLVTGKPGSGKTSLSYAIAYQLKLGPVLTWPINTRSTLTSSLYRYDALARLRDTQQQEDKDIGQYIQLGPVGTAFLPSRYPRVLLIDEIDKSDINLPNDLLNLFEEGEFAIPELVRLSNTTDTLTIQTQDDGIETAVKGGKIKCSHFPVVVMTSNGERDFPPAFFRRCLRVQMPDPTENALREIVKIQLGQELFDKSQTEITKLIEQFSKGGNRATDQLLNTVYLLTQGISVSEEEIQNLLFKELNQT